MKLRSTFFNEEMRKKIRENAEGSDFKKMILEKTEKWCQFTEDQLWESIFASELPRSHMVLSYGWCPSCGQTVTMTGWKIDPFNSPWKVICPHCGEIFPKNDFGRYYLSGINANGIFQADLADRHLLYNEDAPDPEDTKHLFGVDDGSGYKEGGERWLFIATYLKSGLWDQLILAGIMNLSRAYVMTGDRSYARKCGILLDRLADLFPDYDFYEQGVMYEKEYSSRGYISYWCDSSMQLREMLIAYDTIFEEIRDDSEFISYAVEKSRKYNTPYRKNNFADIQRNIETRIFGDAMNNRWKFEANYPWADEFVACVKMVLTRWPEKPDDMAYGVYCILWWVAEEDPVRIMQNVTKADGLTGEKGVQAYSAIALREMTRLISMYGLYEKDMLKKLISRFPKFLRGIRFYINTWFLNAHYPGSGDCGYLSVPIKSIPFAPGYTYFNNESIESSIIYSFEGFLWNLYEITGDIDLIRMMYISRDYDIKKCFTTDFSLSDNPENLQKKVLSLMEEHGAELKQESSNYDEWKLAVLHSGEGSDRRCAYLDYDSGGVHGHNDGMNIGLFFKGQNLMPDLGYPPTHRPGGWSSKFFYWYRSAASHNTVIVDGREHRDFCYVQRDVNGGQGTICESGNSVLWGIGTNTKAIAADDPLMAGVKRFERLLVMTDIDESRCYYLDIFRVEGGREHVKLSRGSVCELDLYGVNAENYETGEDPYGMFFIKDRNEKENFSYQTDPEFKFVRNTKIDKAPSEGWAAEWKYVDKYKGYFGDFEGRDIRLRYTDLTGDAEVITFDSFFDVHNAASHIYPEKSKELKGFAEEMLPGIAISRKSEDPLTSVFAGIYEPFEDNSSIKSIRRLPVTESTGGDMPKTAVAVEVTGMNGNTDLHISADIQRKCSLLQPDWDVETDADLCFVRRTADGRHKISLTGGSYLRIGDKMIENDSPKGVFEIEFQE